MRRIAIAVLFAVLAVATAGVWAPPPSVRAQQAPPDFYLNITGGGSKKLNIAIPEFTVVAGSDSAGLAKMIPTVAGNDLTLSGAFSVVAGSDRIPANNADALRQVWSNFAAAGAHAGAHGRRNSRSASGISPATWARVRSATPGPTRSRARSSRPRSCASA